MDYSNLINTLTKLKKTHPKHLTAKHFDLDYFNSLSDDLKQRFAACVNSGVLHEDSSVGCYATRTDDYETFRPFFSKVIYDYHHVKEGSKHKSTWDFSTLGLSKDHQFDLSIYDINNISMRVRVARNFDNFPLPCKMSKQDRIDLENSMIKVFESLINMDNFGGSYYSLTPGNSYFMSNEEYEKLVNDHIMYKDSRSDKWQLSVGLANDWPYGRGCYISKNRDFIIWIGEEDHLRIMSMKNGTVLNQVFDRLKFGLDILEKISTYSISPDFGVITSCPSNLGTGMRASVHLPLPNLAKKGLEYIQDFASPLGISVRGKHGENTPMGDGGICDISPKARFCISEAEIINKLFIGIKTLKDKDTELCANL